MTIDKEPTCTICYTDTLMDLKHLYYCGECGATLDRQVLTVINKEYKELRHDLEVLIKGGEKQKAIKLLVNRGFKDPIHIVNKIDREIKGSIKRWF